MAMSHLVQGSVGDWKAFGHYQGSEGTMDETKVLQPAMTPMAAPTTGAAMPTMPGMSMPRAFVILCPGLLPGTS